jgi:hypothetical protein
MTADAFSSSRYLRIKRVKELQESGVLDDDMRRLEQPALEVPV